MGRTLKIARDVHSMMDILLLEHHEGGEGAFVYYHNCRHTHSAEFYVMAEMTNDATAEADGEELEIIKVTFRNIRVSNKFINALDLFIDRIDKIKKYIPTGHGGTQAAHVQYR